MRVAVVNSKTTTPIKLGDVAVRGTNVYMVVKMKDKYSLFDIQDGWGHANGHYDSLEKLQLACSDWTFYPMDKYKLQLVQQ